MQRPEDELRDRSNASSEVEFDGTTGWLVGGPGGMRRPSRDGRPHPRGRRSGGSLAAVTAELEPAGGADRRLDDAFCASRPGGDTDGVLGALPAGTAVDGTVGRASVGVSW